MNLITYPNIRRHRNAGAKLYQGAKGFRWVKSKLSLKICRPRYFYPESRKIKVHLSLNELQRNIFKKNLYSEAGHVIFSRITKAKQEN